MTDPAKKYLFERITTTLKEMTQLHRDLCLNPDKTEMREAKRSVDRMELIFIERGVDDRSQP